MRHGIHFKFKSETIALTILHAYCTTNRHRHYKPTLRLLLPKSVLVWNCCGMRLLLSRSITGLWQHTKAISEEREGMGILTGGTTHLMVLVKTVSLFVCVCVSIHAHMPVCMHICKHTKLYSLGSEFVRWQQDMEYVKTYIRLHKIYIDMTYDQCKTIIWKQNNCIKYRHYHRL
jgi:hypothetical protein